MCQVLSLRAQYAVSVPTEKVNHNFYLESVLGESVQHCGVKRNVPFANRKGSTMKSLTQNAQFCLCMRTVATAP